MSASPSLPSPVVPSDVLVAPPALDASQGAAAVKRAIHDGFFRPSDIATATIDEPVLLHVPFWRVEISVDGFHIGIGSIESSRTGRVMPIPTGGARHKDAVVMICGRTIFPYEAKLPSFLSGKLSGVPPLEIGTNELVPRADAALAGEIIDADIDQRHAEKLAGNMVLRAVNPGNALFSTYKPETRSQMFCLYPVYYARYAYAGEARTQPSESCFVAVSGRSGKTIAAKHPSAPRALAAKLRKLLSFDRR
jgi:hypothetical protein